MSMRADPAYRQGLIELVEYVKRRAGAGVSVLEVGSFIGESAELFVANGAVHITCVDPWDYMLSGGLCGPAEEAAFDARLKKHIASGTVRKVRAANLSEAMNTVDDRDYTLVYIDACHEASSVARDIFDACRMRHRTRFLCGHDYDFRKFGGVCYAFHRAFGAPPDAVFRDTSWLVGLANRSPAAQARVPEVAR